MQCKIIRTSQPSIHLRSLQPLADHELRPSRRSSLPRPTIAIMAPANLPSIFNATSQDIEMLLAAQCHLGSKNLQVHMNPYLWKTRYVPATTALSDMNLQQGDQLLTILINSADGVNVINVGKTWYVHAFSRYAPQIPRDDRLRRKYLQQI